MNNVRPFCSTAHPENGEFILAVKKKNPYASGDINTWLDKQSKTIFLLPTVLIILFLSIFPLIASLYVSFGRFQLVAGGYNVSFIDFRNYAKLLSGSEQRHFLGRFGEPDFLLWLSNSNNWFGALLFFAFVGFMVYLLYNFIQRNEYPLSQVIEFGGWVVVLIAVPFILAGPVTQMTFSEEFLDSIGAHIGRMQFFIWFPLVIVAEAIILVVARRRIKNFFGLVMRVISVVFATTLMWITVQTIFTEDGLPGTMVVTFTFVFIGVTVQYLLGLGLAMLVTQNIPGKRFFRVTFLLPMMITPVGIGFLFRMMTDTVKGPFAPLFKYAGLENFTWVNDPWGARGAVLIGDIWQWTPFMFIILLAALEGTSREQEEAALVDGASKWQVFRFVTMPQILPVTLTVIFIRLIEAFKIIDLPQVMTRGGPGTATESMTFHSFLAWRALDLGQSAAVAYLLLIIVTFMALAYVTFLRRRVMELVS